MKDFPADLGALMPGLLRFAEGLGAQPARAQALVLAALPALQAEAQRQGAQALYAQALQAQALQAQSLQAQALREPQAPPAAQAPAPTPAPAPVPVPVMPQAPRRPQLAGVRRDVPPQKIAPAPARAAGASGQPPRLSRAPVMAAKAPQAATAPPLADPISGPTLGPTAKPVLASAAPPATATATAAAGNTPLQAQARLEPAPFYRIITDLWRDSPPRDSQDEDDPPRPPLSPTSQALRRALAPLAPEARLALQLVVLEDFSLAEAALALDQPEARLMAYLARARLALDRLAPDRLAQDRLAQDRLAQAQTQGQGQAQASGQSHGLGDAALLAWRHARLEPGARTALARRIEADPPARAALARWRAQDRALAGLFPTPTPQGALAEALERIAPKPVAPAPILAPPLPKARSETAADTAPQQAHPSPRLMAERRGAPPAGPNRMALGAARAPQSAAKPAARAKMAPLLHGARSALADGLRRQTRARPLAALAGALLLGLWLGLMLAR